MHDVSYMPVLQIERMYSLQNGKERRTERRTGLLSPFSGRARAKLVYAYLLVEENYYLE